MAQIQSLKDLQAENEQEAQNPSVEPQEAEENEPIETVETEPEETEEVAETSEEETEEVETEAWMADQTDDQEEKTVPLSALQKVRGNLKEKNRDLKGELEELKRQNEALQQAQPAPVQAKARPKLEDFEYDEDKYNKAMDDYYLSQVDQRLNQTQTQRQQQEQVQRQQEAIRKASDDHYKRAQELVTKHAISPEVYKNSDEKVRSAFDQISPGNGDSITDHLISILGEGSEKVLFAIGRNQNELDKIQSMYIRDPVGLELSAYLGQKKAEFTMPARKKSQAPKPARQLSGETTKSAATNLHRRYKDAEKKGDRSAAFKVRMEARRAGEDTRDW